MELPHFLLRQQADERHRLAQPCRIVVAAKHRREKLAILPALGDSLPFIIGRKPRALPTPTMKVGQNLRAYLVRRELTRDRKRDRAFEFVERLMRQAGARSRTNTARRHLELIAFTGTPRLENRLRYNYAKGISDTSDNDFHIKVITCCHFPSNQPTIFRI